MSQTVIVIATIGLFVLMAIAIAGSIVGAFRRHDPARAAASVAVTANVPFELRLPGSPGKLFFRFHVDGNAEANDLLISGEVVDEHGDTRALAVKTADRSRIGGASDARPAGIKVAVSDATASIRLDAVHAADRVVRGTVREHPNGLLREGWIYVPRGWW